jgi:hypothetical protein
VTNELLNLDSRSEHLLRELAPQVLECSNPALRKCPVTPLLVRLLELKGDIGANAADSLTWLWLETKMSHNVQGVQSIGGANRFASPDSRHGGGARRRRAVLVDENGAPPACHNEFPVRRQHFGCSDLNSLARKTQRQEKENQMEKCLSARRDPNEVRTCRSVGSTRAD